MDAILQAIMTKTVGSALATQVGSRIYFQEAPDNVAYPLVVFFPVSDVPEYPGGKTMENMLWQFSLFSLSAGLTEITTLLTNLRTLFDDCTLAIAGENLIYFIRGNLTVINEEITTTQGTQTIKHWSQEYEVCTAY